MGNWLDWSHFIGILYPLIIIGLMIDRYWLLEDRLVDSLMKETNKKHKCVICGRPMIVTEDPKPAGDAGK